MTASPMGAGCPSSTCATSRINRAEPLRNATGIRPSVTGSVTTGRCVTARRWLGVSMNPPAPGSWPRALPGPPHRGLPGDCGGAADPRAPGVAGPSGPDGDVRHPRNRHEAGTHGPAGEVVSCIWLNVANSCRSSSHGWWRRAATASREGVRRQGADPRRLPAAPAPIGAPPSGRSLLEDQYHRRKSQHALGAQDSERRDPVHGVLDRNADKALDSGVERPGASVWISTSGGENSGNTSIGVLSAARMPAITSASAIAVTRTL